MKRVNKAALFRERKSKTESFLIICFVEVHFGVLGVKIIEIINLVIN